MPNILLLEDESVLAQNISTALIRSDYSVCHALSARDARALLTVQSFDLVIADISLGDGDGIVLLAEHRAQLTNIPIIVMTGQDSMVNRSRADDIEVAVFLAKPFALSRLREMVTALLEEVGGEREKTPSDNLAVVMYSHDTIGLGHMRRNVSIAQQLVALVPGLSVLLLVGCPAGMMFETQPGIDYVKLPSLTKVGRDRFQAGSLRLDSKTTKAVRAGIIERVITTVRPSIVLVDHEPTGIWNELEPALRQLKKDLHTRVVLGLRDILDDPDKLRARWAANGTDSQIRELYDDVLIYGNETFYPSAAVYGLDQLKPKKTAYCGIVTSASWVSRQRKKIPEYILVAGGGGRDAFPLYSATLSAFEQTPEHLRPALTMVSGPLMEQELLFEIRSRSSRLGVTFHESISDFPALLSQADLFISMGGYNSVNESLVVGCPVVVVPRVGPSSEQRIRAARLHELDLGTVIYREELTADRLQEVMCSEVVTPSWSAAPRLNFTGAATAAKLIARHLNSPVGPVKRASTGVKSHAINL